MRLTVTVEQPDAAVDSTGVVIGLDLHPDDMSTATEHASVQIRDFFLRFLARVIPRKVYGEVAQLAIFAQVASASCRIGRLVGVMPPTTVSPQ